MQTTYWRIKRENLDLKCERNELKNELKESKKVINLLFVFMIVIILLFIF